MRNEQKEEEMMEEGEMKWAGRKIRAWKHTTGKYKLGDGDEAMKGTKG